jgi:DivIVA domain-containing protein
VDDTIDTEIDTEVSTEASTPAGPSAGTELAENDRGITLDAERREFTIVRRGYDPEEVRVFLRELAAAGLKPSPVFEQVGGQVADLLETAHRMSESIEAQAREDAARVKAECEQLRAEAEAAAAAARTEADARVVEAAAKASQIVADAETIAANVNADAEQAVAARVAAAEEFARERATTVIAGTKLRLRKLLDAEREVHARLSSALSSVNADPEVPLDREDEQLLDQAFAEFFGDDVEIEPSRSWILSD